MTENAQINCVLGFDFGHRKIGVATGQTVTGTASALETIPAADLNQAWLRIEQLIREWHPEMLVVGFPLTLQGKTQLASDRAIRFAQELEKRFELPVQMCDERLTTREAKARFKTMRQAGATRRKHAGMVDAVAAQLIVESWLASRQPGSQFSTDGE